MWILAVLVYRGWSCLAAVVHASRQPIRGRFTWVIGAHRWRSTHGHLSPSATAGTICLLPCITAIVWCINSLWPSDATWWVWSRSTFAQVMAWCLTAPSHYLINVDLSSLKISDVHLKVISQEIPQPPVAEISLKIIYLNPRGQWVNPSLYIYIYLLFISFLKTKRIKVVEIGAFYIIPQNWKI